MGGIFGAWGVFYLFFAGCQGFNGLFGFRLAICKIERLQEGE